jgi:hypothetical protein
MFSKSRLPISVSRNNRDPKTEIDAPLTLEAADATSVNSNGRQRRSRIKEAPLAQTAKNSNQP